MRDSVMLGIVEQAAQEHEAPNPILHNLQQINNTLQVIAEAAHQRHMVDAVCTDLLDSVSNKIDLLEMITGNTFKKFTVSFHQDAPHMRSTKLRIHFEEGTITMTGSGNDADDLYHHVSTAPQQPSQVN
jgi:hypothetical protein